MLNAYPSYFVAFLMNELTGEMRKGIKRIILFGSVAREEADKESDIDLFIEVHKKTKKVEKEIFAAVEKFYQSREALLFKAKGINNRIDVKIGRLKEWKDLSSSIASTGIILYGPYERGEFPSEAKQRIIVFWEKIPKNRGAFLNKVYGFRLANRQYPGLLTLLEGKKLGKSCIMLPVHAKRELFPLLKKYKVKAKIIEVFG